MNEKAIWIKTLPNIGETSPEFRHSFEAKKKIMQVIDSFKPDIVHLNNINFQLTPSIIYGIKKRGRV